MNEGRKQIESAIQSPATPYALIFAVALLALPWVCSAGVIGYYTFDDTFQDSSANNFDGTPVNMTFSSDIPAQVGAGKSASWTDETVYRYVDLPPLRGLGPKFTISCWLKTNNARAGWLPILGCSVPQNQHFHLVVNGWNATNRRISLDTRDAELNADSANTADNAFALGVWQHIACVRDGTTVTMYVNGVPASMLDASLQDDFPIDLPLRIGHQGQTTLNNWSGQMDDLAIWDEALDATAIAALAAGTDSPAAHMASPARVVAYYPFDDSVDDFSGLGYHATRTNVTYETDVPPAIGTGKSLYWGDLSAQRYVSLPGIRELNSVFTITCWAKIPSNYTDSAACETILANSIPQKAGFQIYLNSWNTTDKRLALATNDTLLQSDKATSSDNAIAYGSWHHLTFVRNRGSSTFYVDGLPVSMTDSSVNDDFPTYAPARIGHNWQAGTSTNWSGYFDDFAIWNGALSPNIIHNLARGDDSPANHTVPTWWYDHCAGELKGFYRHQTMTETWLKGGGGLLTIPSYWTKAGDFPYQKRPYDKEGVFTDEFILVRPLGGWNATTYAGEAAEPHSHVREFDVAYKDGDVWNYRWDKLFARIDPYTAKGYNKLTLVTDNVCWDFPTIPADFKFGQAAPPSDMAAWKTFIQEMYHQLRTRYGNNTVGAWQFRAGTETHASVRFNGTASQHNSWYDHTTSALREVFPDALVGPGNFYDLTDDRVYPGGWLDFIQYCKDNGKPNDYSCASFYTAGHNQNPHDSLTGLLDEFDAIDAARGKSVAREVHEYGVTKNEFNVETPEPGAWGAARHFQLLMGLHASGVSKVQHWGITENAGSGVTLLYGVGWVYMVLDHLRTGDFFELTPPTDSPLGTQYRAYAVNKEGKSYLLVSAFNPSRTETDSRSITVEFPRDMIAMAPASLLDYVALTPANSMYDMIRADLAAAGKLLSPWTENASTIGTLSDMGGTAGKTLVAGNWPQYEQAFHDSLTFAPFPADRASTATHHRLTFPISNPTVLVIAIENDGNATVPASGVSFTAAGQNADESAGMVELMVQATGATTPITANVTFDAGNSTASTGDIGNYTTQTVTLNASNSYTANVTVSLTDDNTPEGDETAVFHLADVVGATTASPSAHTLTLPANDSFAAWAAGYNITATLTANNDADKFLNGWEYAFDLNPTVVEYGNVLASAMNLSGGNVTLTLAFNGNSSKQDINYVVRRANNPGFTGNTVVGFWNGTNNWTLNNSTYFANATQSGNGTVKAVNVIMDFPVSTDPAEPRQFLKVDIE